MQFRHRPQGQLPMSNEKRFAFFVVLMFAWLLGFPYILKFFGLAPPPLKVRILFCCKMGISASEGAP